ncbi:hypothetical protein OGLPLLMI_00039 [Enterobacter phage phiT5282H]|uniref:Uncharacterized protein n=1 Tax=Enterobacter phage phiT5282H TaxID=2340712 RepID=A0A386K4S9_9CAUD|nr:hypothetical protein HYP56_gp39 [Enterobacter phage phiT5282H]AYD79805.1 hypothetical protein OGLPLLMI_00039 [Enterobacter phage phiT5282H]
MGITGSYMRGQFLIYISLNLNNGIINIFTGCQYHGRIDFQRYSFGAADNQDHANHLHAPAAFLQLWFISLCTVGNRNHIAVFIKQADLTDPPSAHIFRYDLFRNDLIGVNRVNSQHIQLRTAQLMRQRGLCRVRCRQRAVTIAYGHLGDLNLRTQCRGVCQFCRPDIG